MTKNEEDTDVTGKELLADLLDNIGECWPPMVMEALFGETRSKEKSLAAIESLQAVMVGYHKMLELSLGKEVTKKGNTYLDEASVLCKEILDRFRS